MKNTNHKKAIIAVIIGVVAITGAALYLGDGEAFQGYFRQNINLRPSVRVNRTTPVKISQNLSVTCAPDKNSIKTGEDVIWRATVSNGEENTLFTYTWSGDVGDEEFTGPIKGQYLSRKSFSTFYSRAGTYTPSLKVRTSGSNDAVEAKCSSIEVTKAPLAVTPINTLNPSAITKGALNTGFSVSCSPSKSTVKSYEHIIWKAEIVGAKSNDTLDYTWSGSTGKAQLTGPSVDEPLHKPQFQTFYISPETHTVKLTVEKTTPFTGEGWAPIEDENKETVEVECSVDVELK